MPCTPPAAAATPASVAEHSMYVDAAGLMMELIEHTLVLLDSWDAPAILRRAHCLREIVLSHERRTRVDVVLGSTVREKFELAFGREFGPLHELLQTLGSVDLCVSPAAAALPPAPACDPTRTHTRARRFESALHARKEFCTHALAPREVSASSPLTHDRGGRAAHVRSWAAECYDEEDKARIIHEATDQGRVHGIALVRGRMAVNRHLASLLRAALLSYARKNLARLPLPERTAERHVRSLGTMTKEAEVAGHRAEFGSTHPTTLTAINALASLHKANGAHVALTSAHAASRAQLCASTRIAERIGLTCANAPLPPPRACRSGSFRVPQVSSSLRSRSSESACRRGASSWVTCIRRQ